MPFITIRKKTFVPPLNLDYLLSFYPFKGETFTNNPFVDAVLSTIGEIRPTKNAEVANYLGLKTVKLSHTLEVFCGCTLQDVIRGHRALRLREVLLSPEAATLSTDKLAYKAGFYDRSSMENFFKSKRNRRFFADIDLKEIHPNRYVNTDTRRHPHRKKD